MLDEHFRYETNTRVRQILISNNADMTRVNYSCIKKTIYVYGSLNKTTQGEFTVADIKNCSSGINETAHIRDVQFDF